MKAGVEVHDPLGHGDELGRYLEYLDRGGDEFSLDRYGEYVEHMPRAEERDKAELWSPPPDIAPLPTEASGDSGSGLVAHRARLREL